MEANLNSVLEQVSKDKGIERQTLIEALEEAILASAKRTFGIERNLEAHYNPEKGAVDLTQSIRVVEKITDFFNEIELQECQSRGIEVDVGDEMVFPIYYLERDAQAAREQDDMYGDILRLKTYRRSFGRIAAQTAKQVIIYRIRDAERNQIYSEYRDRKGELVTGIVRRLERGNIIVDLGRAEAILPMREQCSRETYRTGDRVQAYVLEVEEHTRGPQIVLSRTCPELLVKLFELEVPEIYEGIVRIESCSREPGARAKIAVSSTDRDVDPVGACVGMKGSRVQAVVQELRGEKIDIVPYSEDQATFVCNALQPAEVSRVLIDETNHAMEIIVPDDVLSLAIGRKGQNVRLAAQLTGWRLDIHSESRIQEIKERAFASLAQVEGCNEFLIQTLYNHGIRSAAALLATNHDFLLQFPGMNEELMQKILSSAEQVAEKEREQEIQQHAHKERTQRINEIAASLQKLIDQSEKEKFSALRGIGSSLIDKLEKANMLSIPALQDCAVEDLVVKLDITDKRAKQLLYAVSQQKKQEEKIHAEATACGIHVEEGQVKLPDTLPNQEQEPAWQANATATPDLTPLAHSSSSAEEQDSTPENSVPADVS